jgi:hypothetical protein
MYHGTCGQCKPCARYHRTAKYCKLLARSCSIGYNSLRSEGRNTVCTLWHTACSGCMCTKPCCTVNACECTKYTTPSSLTVHRVHNVRHRIMCSADGNAQRYLCTAVAACLLIATSRCVKIPATGVGASYLRQPIRCCKHGFCEHTVVSHGVHLVLKGNTITKSTTTLYATQLDASCVSCLAATKATQWQTLMTAHSGMQSNAHMLYIKTCARWRAEMREFDSSCLFAQSKCLVCQRQLPAHTASQPPTSCCTHNYLSHIARSAAQGQ